MNSIINKPDKILPSDWSAFADEEDIADANFAVVIGTLKTEVVSALVLPFDNLLTVTEIGLGFKLKI